LLLRWQAIEALGVAITHGVLVCGGESGILFQFFQLVLAGVVVDFMGKVRRKNKGLVADDADGEG